MPRARNRRPSDARLSVAVSAMRGVAVRWSTECAIADLHAGQLSHVWASSNTTNATPQHSNAYLRWTLKSTCSGDRTRTASRLRRKDSITASRTRGEVSAEMQAAETP